MHTNFKTVYCWGHCVSHTVVLEHDTALAALQLERKENVPEGFRNEVPATLIWDNNDFGEETLSGAGTTHNTNGIVIQKVTNDGVDLSSTPKQIPKSR